MKLSDWLVVLTISGILGLVGCQVQLKRPDGLQTDLGKVGMATPTAVPTVAPTTHEASIEVHQVVKGDCLWNISKSKQTYGDGFLWPLIYKSNRDQISNPDLIEPGWQLKMVVPSFPDIAQARKESAQYPDKK